MPGEERLYGRSKSQVAQYLREGRYQTLVDLAPKSAELGPIDRYFVAVGLMHLGWCHVGSAPSKRPDAEGLLGELIGSDAGAGLVALARVTSVRARLERDHPRGPLLDELREIGAQYGHDPVVAMRERLTRGLLLIRGRQLAAAESALRDALRRAEDDLQDPFSVGEAQLGIGRVHAWQGRAEAASQAFAAARQPWEHNSLMAADVDYEDAYMQADRRSYGAAAGLFDSVLVVHADLEVGSVKRARTVNAAVNALLGAGRLDEAARIMEAHDAELAATKQELKGYRLAMRLRDKARRSVGRACDAVDSGASASEHVDRAVAFIDRAREESGNDSVDSYTSLALGMVEARARALHPAASAMQVLAAGDSLVRIAEAFAGRSAETPHQIAARLAAIEAYLGVRSRGNGGREEAAAQTFAAEQSERLAGALASLRLSLRDDPAQDPEAHRVLAALRASGLGGVDRFVRLMAGEREETDLQSALAQGSKRHRAAILARVADIVAERHRSGLRPMGLVPSRIVVVEPDTPVLKPLDGKARWGRSSGRQGRHAGHPGGTGSDRPRTQRCECLRPGLDRSDPDRTGRNREPDKPRGQCHDRDFHGSSPCRREQPGRALMAVSGTRRSTRDPAPARNPDHRWRRSCRKAHRHPGSHDRLPRCRKHCTSL